MGKWYKSFAPLILSVSLLVPGFSPAYSASADTHRESITKMNQYLGEDTRKGAITAAYSLGVPDVKTQYFALEVLSLYGTPEELPALQQLMETAKQSEIKQQAEAVRAEILLRSTEDDQKRTDYLKECLEHKNPLVVAVAQKASRSEAEEILEVKAGDVLPLTQKNGSKDKPVEIEVVSIGDPDQVILHEEWNNSSTTDVYEWQTDADLSAGLYRVTIKAKGNKTAPSEESHTVLVKHDSTAPLALAASTDTYEPNDTISTAYATGFNRTITSYISTDTDQDMYRPYSSTPMVGVLTVTLTVPSGVDYDLWLYDDVGNVIRGSTNGPGVSEQLTTYVSSKRFYVQVTSPDHTFDAIRPYSLNFGALRAESETYEPNDIFESAYSVSLGTGYSVIQNSYLSHGDDFDFYKFIPKSSGLMGIEIGSKVADADLEIFNQNRELVNWSKTIHSDEKANVWVQANETYYVKVFSGDQWTGAGAYSLKIILPRADSFELNDRPDIATPVLAGSTFTSYLSVPGDIDNYVLDAKDDDQLSVTFTPQHAYYTIAIYEDDSAGGWNFVKSTMPNTGASHTLSVGTLVGKKYLFKINQNDVFSNQAYTLSLSNYTYENFEPNDETSTATELIGKKLITSWLYRESDLDYYRFVPMISSKHHLTVKVPVGRTYQVRILDSQLNEVAVGTPVVGQAHELEFRSVAGQSYFIEVTGSDGSFSFEEPYLLCISPVLYEYRYDPANRLLSTTLQKGTHLQQLLFTYDENGNLLKKSYSMTEVVE